MNNFIKDSFERAGQFYSMGLDFAKAGDLDTASAHFKWGKEQITLAEMKAEEEMLIILESQKK